MCVFCAIDYPCPIILCKSFLQPIIVARENGYQQILSKRGERNARAAIRKRNTFEATNIEDDSSDISKIGEIDNVCIASEHIENPVNRTQVKIIES